VPERRVLEQTLRFGSYKVLYVLLDLQVIPLHHCLAHLAHLEDRAVLFLFPLQDTADVPDLALEAPNPAVWASATAYHGVSLLVETLVLQRPKRSPVSKLPSPSLCKG
jgi:hypothetical protein